MEMELLASGLLGNNVAVKLKKMTLQFNNSWTYLSWFTLAMETETETEARNSIQTLPFSYVLSPSYRVCMEFCASASVSIASVNQALKVKVRYK